MSRVETKAEILEITFAKLRITSTIPGGRDVDLSDWARNLIVSVFFVVTRADSVDSRSSNKAGSEDVPVEAVVLIVSPRLAVVGFVRPPAWRGFAVDELAVVEKRVVSLPV